MHKYAEINHMNTLNEIIETNLFSFALSSTWVQISTFSYSNSPAPQSVPKGLTGFMFPEELNLSALT